MQAIMGSALVLEGEAILHTGCRIVGVGEVAVMLPTLRMWNDPLR